MKYFKLLNGAYDSLPAEAAIQKAIIFKVVQYYDKSRDTVLSAIKLVKKFTSKVFFACGWQKCLFNRGSERTVWLFVKIDKSLSFLDRYFLYE